MVGICLLERPISSLERHMHLPIADFSVPKNKAQIDLALKRVFTALLRGEQAYVGCGGGWGSTGLFLSLVAKVSGELDHVNFVRNHYALRAVETEVQHAYIEAFDVEELQRWLCWAAVRHLRHRLH